MHITNRTRQFDPRRDANMRRASPSTSLHAERSRPLAAEGSQAQPPSAARLAAEALFSGGSITSSISMSPAAAIPVVVFKKRANHNKGLASVEEASSASPVAVSAVRSPRVFTVRQSALQGAGAHPAEQGVVADSPSSQASSIQGAKRRRHTDRIGHDRRARTLRQVVVRPGPERGGSPRAEPLDVEARDPTLRQSAHVLDDLDMTQGPASLVRQLVKLDEVFAAIHAARSFTLVDSWSQREWARLARVANWIAGELKAL
jgi:hypothetical protein